MVLIGPCHLSIDYSGTTFTMILLYLANGGVPLPYVAF